MGPSGRGRVRDALADSSILLTGASGFLGQAVLATLLGSGADFRRLTVLLRAADDTAAQRRLEDELLAGAAFDALPADSIRGRLAAGRLIAAAADLAVDGLGDRGEWHDVDTVIHCAASVSFEEPLDEALALNALGPRRLLDCLRRAGARPHFVHVSTAYVADPRLELVTEDGPSHPGLADLDVGVALELAGQWRGAAEEEATRPGRLRQFEKAAQGEASRRPGLDPHGRAQELRRRWSNRRLAEEGRRYAVAAGWPDTYALSKALGERLLLDSSERTTIIRPSIIESSIRDPSAGWLEGIKVADPLILAYAAGGLTHLPGKATNPIDIVPVDHVAHACVAAAAYPPKAALRLLNLTSSARNTLTLGDLAAHTRGYFRREPLERRDGSPIAIGDLAFVDRGVAVKKAMRRERLARTASRAIGFAPLPTARKEGARRNGSAAAQMVRLVKIYAPYTELCCVFDDRNARAFAGSLSSEDRAEFPFDTATVPWEEYLQGIHLPKLHVLARQRSGTAAPAAQTRGESVSLSGET